MTSKSNHSQQSIPNTPLRFLWYLGTKYKFLGAISFLLVIGAETLNVFIFYVSAQLVDSFTLAQTLDEQKAVLIFWGIIFLIVSAGNSILYRISGYTALHWIIQFHKDGYNELYNHLSRHSHSYFSNRFAGALSNKVSNAVDSSAGLMFQILWTFFSEFIGLLVTLVLFFLIDVRIGLALLLIFMVVLLFNIFAVRYRRPYVVTYAAASSKSRGEGVDVISNISTVRQFANYRAELRRLDGVFTDRARKDRVQTFIGEHIMVTNTLFAILMTAIILWMLFHFLTEDIITAGILVLVLGLLGRVGVYVYHCRTGSQSVYS